ncbi:DNA mismatch repair endonuclease MutL [Crateriforma conspicua]|uniref:DNA mismatch repair protein MutL n=1 Tax=Crateriforma conspicua TaxID=2527996 RepID=A0A5C5YE39_9PLAN|nr:DNA mismatch repair endonuclease MutL [Crateriforma conspicua]QDV61185.1 DNA mismatch repair protein MutL [Crateriforma conspicua]TWT72565.1 DNA mismatch repair protein MutL [Crateriforma conspicua]
MTSIATTPPVIRQLPPNLVNQIAAGEVIERPASVVKELLENSIDAGAKRVELTIQGGGSELIRISDDGCGIAEAQMPLAVTSHATSKLPDDEMLFHVGTLGFRGEALASIASVSQMTIRSRPADADIGSELNVRGGVIEGPAPCGCPTGTVIEVKNLFFNTPVRHKFLKTTQTERGHITEAFTRLALANPDVHFVYRQGEKLLHDLPPTVRWADRIAAFFGAEIAESLIPVHSDDSAIGIDGFVCDPSVSRGNNRMQYLFLNGRHIRDRSLQHALGESYRGMLMVGRQPICFLRLTMPPSMIDVNVHPTKQEVRFTDGGRVYSRLLQTLRHHFLTSNLTQRVGPPAPVEPQSLPNSGSESVMGMSVKAVDQQRQSVINWAQTGQDSTSTPGPIPDFRPFPSGGVSTGLPSSPTVNGSTETPVQDVATDTQASTDDVAPWDGDDPSTPVQLPRDTTEAGTASPTVSYLGSQVHNRYLVTQDEKGMVVIDQHALHERVLYERVCQKVLHSGQRLEAQRLLVPETIALTPGEHAAALEVQETLAQIGLEIEDFGGDTIAIHSYPAMLPKRPPGEMLHVVLESLLGAGKQPDAKDLLNHLLATIACKAAVKAGDPLTGEEITSLLEQRDLYHETHHCPHGRPTALFFSLDELDRMFGRLGPRSRN